MYYGARYYLPELRRFISPDTIIPGTASPQALNRYSYTINNPIRLTDPTGHVFCPAGVSEYECRPAATQLERQGRKMLYTTQRATRTNSVADPYGDKYLADNYTPDQMREQVEARLVGLTADDPLLRTPDYYTISGTILVVGGVTGPSFALTLDYYRNWYFSVGWGVGGGVNLSGGWLNQDVMSRRRPPESYMQSNLSGLTSTLGGGYGLGGGITLTNPGAIEVGLYSPGGGITGSRSFVLHDANVRGDQSVSAVDRFFYSLENPVTALAPPVPKGTSDASLNDSTTATHNSTSSEGGWWLTDMLHELSHPQFAPPPPLPMFCNEC